MKTITKIPIVNPLIINSKEFDLLTELALNLHWSWNHTTDYIWQTLNPTVWDITHNPWAVLQTISPSGFELAMNNDEFKTSIHNLLKIKNASKSHAIWFEQKHHSPALTCVAYFSMEYMLSEALPIYSGGLGNVAGDQLKAASDLGVPTVAIGLLYQQGYFRQSIGKDGAQHELYPFNDPTQLPISPLRRANGEWLRLEIDLPGYSVWLRAWQVQVGRVKLYLLDSNDVANFPIHRGITSELYGGDAELRLKQELLLGIGGWRLLKALGIRPEVCHLNEGHAAFAVLERAYDFMKENGQSFDIALNATRVGNVFTTHTAVEAGFDKFSPLLIEQYLGKYAEQKLGITLNQLLALGRSNCNNNEEQFNMAYLAFRGSGAANGVSRLHGNVSRHIFEPLFVNWTTAEVPVSHVTNGVHMPTWDSKEADKIWTDACGKDRWLGKSKPLGNDIRDVSDEKLWAMRTNANKTLIAFATEYVSKQLLGSGHTQESADRAKQSFSSKVLTLGFAKRFASYKRPNLLLTNPDRLLKILTNVQFPVQLIISGKAHSGDLIGQRLIKEWMQFIRQCGVHPPVIFLADYDMYISEQLVQGVDVWLNTPRRPWEASGTSGMKVLVNGGINLSVLDGWWVEAYNPQVGWALGDGHEHADDEECDAKDANELYDIIEQQIVPEFYTKNENGIPTAWIKRMRESMAQLTPQFSADRTVREYTEKFYMPAAKAYTHRAASKGLIAKHITEQINATELNWHTMYFGDMVTETINDNYRFDIKVYFGNIDPDSIQIELYANGIGNEPPFIQKMGRGTNTASFRNGFHFNAIVPANRAITDYTARVIPCIKDVSVPLEISQILWQK